MKLFKTGFAVALSSLLFVQGLNAAISSTSRTDYREQLLYFLVSIRVC